MKKITKVFGVALFAISMLVTGCSNSGDTEKETEDIVTFETLGVADFAESQRIIEIGFPRAKATIPIMIRKNYSATFAANVIRLFITAILTGKHFIPDVDCF